MKKTNNKGFSLVELIIVIAIMAILIGVLAPQYIKYVEKSRVSADKDMIDSLTKAAQTATTDDDYYDILDNGANIQITGSGVTINGDSNGGLSSAISEFYGTVASNKFKSKKFNGQTVTITISQDTTNSNLKVTVTDTAYGTYDPTNY